MDKVQVLISTYNGEKYIISQIESILNQTYKNISILIRDDGSTDNTVKILEMFQEKGLVKYYSSGNNIGHLASFFDLIHNADKSCNYFAFADQDDYWMPNRIENAINDIANENINIPHSIPILHSCRFRLADENLNPIKKKVKISKPIGLGNTLIECPFLGFTLFFNNKMLEFMDKVKNTENVRGHDTTISIIACMFGRTYTGKSYDILYRQHSKNFSGGLGKTFLREINIRARMLLFFIRNNILTKNAEAVYKIYESIMDDRNREIFLKFINRNKSITNRISIIFDKQFRRQSFLHNFIIKIIFLLGLRY